MQFFLAGAFFGVAGHQIYSDHRRKKEVASKFLTYLEDTKSKRCLGEEDIKKLRSRYYKARDQSPGILLTHELSDEIDRIEDEWLERKKKSIMSTSPQKQEH